MSFYFNGNSVRYVGVFDAQKNEEKLQIEALSDIYKYAEKLEKAVKAHS